MEVAPQGGHQAVVLIQEVALALRQAEVGEGPLRVALAGGGLALAVVLHKQVVLLQHRLDLPGLFVGDEPLPHRFPGGQVVDAGRAVISRGRKSFIRPEAGTSKMPWAAASSKARRFSWGRYWCWVMVVPSKSKASKAMFM